MTKHGKKYVEAEKQIPAEPVSPLAAMKLLKEVSVANFDETVTGDFRLGIDTRQADQQLRGTVSLPHGRSCRSRWVRWLPERSRISENRSYFVNTVLSGSSFLSGKNGI